MVCLDLVHLLQVEFSKPLLGANGPAATLAGELPLAGELYLPNLCDSTRRHAKYEIVGASVAFIFLHRLPC